MSDYRTSVEAFSLHADESSVHYERDHDLTVNTKPASRGGRSAGLLLVELGIDGSETHGIRLDFSVPDLDPDSFRYELGADEVRALTDAIDALTAVRDRLEAMAD